MYEDDYSVPIPARVKTRMEIIEGVGVPEMITTGIAAIISGILAYIINLVSGNIIAALIFFAIITGGTFLFVMKDKNNQCIAGIFVNMFKFYISQRKYIYEAEIIEYYNSYIDSLKEKD